jgi:two-component system, response regulator PdtaR
MFSEDQKVIQRITPVLKRVLIVDPQPAGARMLADLIRNLVPCQILVAPTVAKAAELLQAGMPQVVFVEMTGQGLDGIELTRKLRRSDFAARQVPVIMAASAPTAQSIKAARDAGAHEFLCKPFTTKDLLRRLEAVVLRQRPWVEAVRYIGPDRRRFNSGAYVGPRKRGADLEETPEAAKIAQAFKILRSASLALAADPAQALRSMRAQAIDLYQGGVATGDARLTAASSDFMRFLAEVRAISADNSAAVLSRAGALLQLTPSETEAAPARQAA